MCKVLSFIVCENVNALREVSSDGSAIYKPQIVCPIDTLKLFSVPSYFSFAVFGSLAEISGNSGNNVIYVTVYSPEGSEVYKTNEMKLPKLNRPEATVQFSFDYRNTTFEICGTYKVKLFLNGKMIAETQFKVEVKKESE